MNVEIIGDSPLLSKINGIIGSKKKPASGTKKTVKPAVKAEAPVKADSFDRFCKRRGRDYGKQQSGKKRRMR